MFYFITNYIKITLKYIVNNLTNCIRCKTTVNNLYSHLCCMQLRTYLISYGTSPHFTTLKTYCIQNQTSHNCVLCIAISINLYKNLHNL